MVVGRESWGALYAIFVPRDGGAVRQALLKAKGTDEAHRELEEMADVALLDLLGRAEPKEPE